MTRLPNYAYTLLTIAIVVLTSLTSARSQTRESNTLDHHFDSVTIKEASIILALNGIANDNSLPIGLEVAAAQPESPEREINLTLKDTTLRTVLNEIIKQDSRYTWISDGGVIYFYAKLDRDPLLQDLLATNLGEFTIGGDRTTSQVRNRILELPEIKAKLERAKVSPLVIFWRGADHGKLEDGFSSQIANVTLKSLLDQIILHSTQKFWMLNRYGKSNEYVVLNF
jgi:hypothetical protein